MGRCYQEPSPGCSLHLKTDITDTNDLDVDLPEIILSLVGKGGEKINDNHNVRSDLLCTFKTVMKLSKK